MCALWWTHACALVDGAVRLGVMDVCSVAAGLFAQLPQGLEHFVLAKAARALHFFCPNKRNETKKIRRLHFFPYSGAFLR